MAVVVSRTVCVVAIQPSTCKYQLGHTHSANDLNASYHPPYTCEVVQAI